MLHDEMIVAQNSEFVVEVTSKQPYFNLVDIDSELSWAASVYKRVPCVDSGHATGLQMHEVEGAGWLRLRQASWSSLGCAPCCVSVPRGVSAISAPSVLGALNPASLPPKVQVGVAPLLAVVPESSVAGSISGLGLGESGRPRRCPGCATPRTPARQGCPGRPGRASSPEMAVSRLLH